ncbi:unnamed protein product [Victoria cruziana]
MSSGKTKTTGFAVRKKKTMFIRSRHDLRLLKYLVMKMYRKLYKKPARSPTLKGGTKGDASTALIRGGWFRFRSFGPSEACNSHGVATHRLLYHLLFYSAHLGGRLKRVEAICLSV